MDLDSHYILIEEETHKKEAKVRTQAEIREAPGAQEELSMWMHKGKGRKDSAPGTAWGSVPCPTPGTSDFQLADWRK